MGFFLRIWLLATLPLRLAYELFQAFNPPTELSLEPVPGTTHKNGSAKTEVSADGLSKEKLKKLDERMDYWWGSNLPAPVRTRRLLKGRRQMNKVRIPLIIEAYYKNVLGRANLDPTSIATATPLLGAKICEVGCGGGYLTEALVQLGADVVGIDADEYDIMTAKNHWRETQGADRTGPEYYHTQVKEFTADHSNEFDLVICSEMLQYHPNGLGLVSWIGKLVREGGCLILTTTNRSIPALLFVIAWIEHIAGTMPAFTNRLFRFLKPEEINDVVKAHGYETVNIAGFLPLGITMSLKWRMQWLLTSYTGIWYALVAKKLETRG